MQDSLTNFDKHSQYETYINGQDATLPNVSTCNDDKKVHYKEVDYSKRYLRTVALESGTIGFKIPAAVTTTNVTSISYSTDNGTTWTTTNNTNSLVEISVNVNNGDTILWKGNAQQLANSSSYSQFYGTASFNVDGNMMSLCYGDNFVGQTTLNYSYQFRALFYESKVVSAKHLSLPATTLSEHCYSGMFRDCTSLTTAPTLPDSTLANYCYGSMFLGCTALTTAPKLPATILTEGCYYNMFGGCTSLTTAPELPSTTLEDGCYAGMFSECESLTTAPNLPATTLAEYCYHWMFSYCTSLTTAPTLPATTLADYCYTDMFCNCTSLTTAPTLPATTLTYGCYVDMFGECSSLNYIKALFTTTPSPIYTDSWVDGVAARGTFVKNANSTWNVTGVDGVPNGWEVSFSGKTILKEIWVDDFKGLSQIKSTLDDVVSYNCDYYTYTGDTITMNGKTCYIWERQFNPNIDEYVEHIPYLLTTTIDYNELYSQSLEQNFNNDFISLVGRFNEDLDTMYGCGSEEMFLLKVNRNGNELGIYVDEFDVDLIYNEIEDPLSTGANKYVYSGQTITIDDNEYYVWEKTSNEYNVESENIYYLLTTTVDYNELYSQSLEYDLGNSFTSLVGRFYEDLDTMYNDPHEIFLLKIRKIRHKRKRKGSGNEAQKIWVDDFPIKEYDVDRSTLILSEIANPDSTGANPYLYTGETITIDNNVYYVWEYDSTNENFNEESGVNYLLTTMVDYNELYSQSLEENVNNEFTSFFATMNSDSEITYINAKLLDGTDRCYLIKVE